MRRLMLLVAVVVGVAVALGASGAASPSGSAKARWVITDLGTLGGGESQAVELNASGQIVGWSDMPRTNGGYSRRHAFRWESGKMRDLGTVGRDLGGDMPNTSEAVAINDRGQIIGNSSVNQNEPVSYAFVSQQGHMTAITAKGGLSSVAAAINATGQVVGWVEGDVVGDEGLSGLGYGTGHAFMWQGGKMTDLGTLPGRPYSWANAVNERGQIVGNSYAIDDQQDGAQVKTRAALWQKGKITDLGTLPGGSESDAIAINASGQVIGTSYDQHYFSRGFLWQNGKMTDLGSVSPVAITDRGEIIANSEPPNGHGRAFVWQKGKLRSLGTVGGARAQAVAINASGQIVGNSGDSSTNSTVRPFLWQNGKLTSLPMLPGRIGGAVVAINEHNQIVGWSTTKTFKKHAVLWTLKTGG